ncbi:hotdog fold domain-containing protein [Nocardia sp. alder85J]|uniref:hotdog fold domain-containing protein n=1 Tax=Nocardia sp. alder85J TaxID=2862949 RepID=UPI001CD41337|nr:hotdog fold domain-containing protein [Nocardia sp. alder85J]MCX4098463.1 hotdog fold domain-containing protein [Nocardia sp. alder85J]
MTNIEAASDIWEPSWEARLEPTAVGADEFAALIEATRAVQEAVTRSCPTPAAAARVAAALREIASELEEFEADEDGQLAGKRYDLAGRGHPLPVPLHIETVTDTAASARIVVGRFHSGRYALNGGVTTLIFDEILARVANGGNRPWARTACLTVQFRAPAPLHTELRVTAELVGREGRKRFMRGAMYHGDQVVAEAEGLWVELRPEQTQIFSNNGTEVSER